MIDVVLPVYNQADLTEKCIDSVLRDDGPIEFRLLVFDDASTDERLQTVLRRATADPRCVVFRNPTNRGFVANVNRGLRMSRSDVVILNSDTEVTAGWLAKLYDCAQSRADVASVTPLTNHGTIAAVPEWNRTNQVPQGWTLEDYGRLVESLSRRSYPELPTGVGFCMYMTRKALDEIGAFDAATFPRGYGEENDWCMKASAAGYVHLLDDATFVFHAGGGSFREETRRLMEANYRILTEKHPLYEQLVHDFIERNPLAEIQGAIRRATWSEHSVPRVLMTLHAPIRTHGIFIGGTEAHSWDLIESVPGVEFIVAFPSKTDSLIIEEYAEQGRTLVRRREVRPPAADRERFYASLLDELKIDVLHVQHLLNQDDAIVSAAKRGGRPIVFVWHDHHLACERFNLVDDLGEFCDWCADLSVCDRCLASDGHARGHQRAWRRRSSWILRIADAIIFPSRSALEGAKRVFQLNAERVAVIPHGRLLERAAPSARRPPSSVLRAAFIGGWSAHKGRDTFLESFQILAGDDIEWHAFGVSPREADAVPSGIRHHGRYDRDELGELLRRKQIDVALLLSIWPETFCYTLTECWAAGIPVVGSRLGAIGERIRREGGGWVVDPTDSFEVADLLRRLRTDPSELERRTLELESIRLPRRSRMGADYGRLYRRLAAPSGTGPVADERRPA